MRIFNNSVRLNKKMAVLSADIEFKNGKRRTVFFETEKKYQSFFASDMSPFFAAFLFIAMHKREDMIIEGTISKKLFENSKEIMDLLLSWNAGFKRISIKINGFTREKRKATKVGLFFSGGVDSLYTYLKNRKQITHLLFVHGMDIRLNEESLYLASIANIKRVADREGVVLIPVRTNMRDSTDSYVTWKFGHGAILAGISLALSNGFLKIFISGGMYEKALRPYGTHPHLDHLWSTESLTIKHFGHHLDRLAKISFLSRFPQSIERLRVCWVNTGYSYNCGRCEKCLRTMLSLYTVGILHKSKSFPKEIDLSAMESLYIDEKNHYRYFRENLVILQKQNRAPELAKAIKQCLHKNEQQNMFVKIYRNTRREIANIDARYFHGMAFMFIQRRALREIV